MAMDTTETEAVRGTIGGTGKRDASVPEDAPVFEATASFEAAPAARLYANRALRARVKVNSTRQGTPRPYGPWSPGFVARAADSKSNEVDVPPSLLGTWPGSVTDTMEYTAFAALGRGEVGREPDAGERVPIPRVPMLGPPQRTPRTADESRVSLLVRDTAPIGGPDAAMAEPREEPARARVQVRTGSGRGEVSGLMRLPPRETVEVVAPAATAVAAPPETAHAEATREEAGIAASPVEAVAGATVPAEVVAPLELPAPDHRTERLVAGLLVLFALALVYLIAAAP